MFFPFCSFSVSLFLLSVLFSLFPSFPLSRFTPPPFSSLLFLSLFFLFPAFPFLSSLFFLFFSFPLPFSFFLSFFRSFYFSRFAPPPFSSFLFLSLFFLFPAFPLSFSFFLAFFFCSFPLSRFALSPLFPFLPFSFSLSLVFFTSCYLRIKSFFTIVRKTIRQLYE